MMTLTNQTELFVELSDEQAEVVSGGIALLGFDATTFAKDTRVLAKVSEQGSGPNGSYNKSVLAAGSEKIGTGALSFLGISV